MNNGYYFWGDDTYLMSFYSITTSRCNWTTLPLSSLLLNCCSLTLILSLLHTTPKSYINVPNGGSLLILETIFSKLILNL